MAFEVHEDQYRMFQILLNTRDAVDFPTLIFKACIEQSMAMGTLTHAMETGWVEMQEKEREELVPSENLIALVQQGLPERRFLPLLEHGPLPMKEAVAKAEALGIKINEVVKWGTLRGWLEKRGAELALTSSGTKALQQEEDDEKALKIITAPEQHARLEKEVKQGIRFTNNFFLDELKVFGLEPERMQILKKRPELLKIKERTIRWVKLTDKGRSMLADMCIKAEEKNQLTEEDIVSGNWKKITLRPYDVTLPAETVAPKKCHPLQKILQEARRAFLQMGFEESVSPQVELSFWDFDALFQPQDHPSRDMQDTFYLKTPEKGTLPDPKLVEMICQTHENGGNTGSTGWGYCWKAEEARKMVMRTHTTATSIRAIAQNPEPPRKVFCVGRVFRNETINFKHLPEFHQVDGIIIDKDASLSCLLGTLQQFYHVMGFAKVKFKPAFFPYTEPSAEVFVWMESKKCWIELGGSGIFRPEVTRPFGCKVPVMAWGLGLERLAMLRYGISDIRVLYGSDLDWLEEVRLCQ